MFSAHQMGTARMGVNPKKSCVDPEGQCWEVRSLSQGTLLLWFPWLNESFICMPGICTYEQDLALSCG